MRHTKSVLRLLAITLFLAFICSFVPSVSAASREEQLQSKIRQIIAQMPSSVVSDADKSLYLHDYIVKNVAYEMVGDHQSAYGALLDGKAVCAGYADAYKRLLDAVGIKATTITGYAYDANGNQERHAWTMLTIDGKCLFTDVTWDDPFINGVQDPNYVGHDYFHITLEQMSKNHIPDDSFKSILPASCNHTGYDFYSIMQSEGSGYGIFNDSTTVSNAIKYFKYLGVVDGKDAFYCEFRFDGDGAAWIQNNWLQIAKALGLSGSLGLKYQYGGYALSMTVSGTLNKIVNVTSISLNCLQLSMTKAGETFQLITTILPENATSKAVTYASTDPSVATVSQTGLITALSNGTAVITATSTSGNISASCLVVVSIPEKPTQPETPPTQPTQPTQPSTQPTNPPVTEPTVPPATLPTDPTAATDPTVTTEPSAPVDPTEPTDPMEPTDPVDPTYPMDPACPTDPQETQKPMPTQDPNNTEPTQNGTDIPVTDENQTGNTQPSTDVQADAQQSDVPHQRQEEDSANKAPIVILVVLCPVMIIAAIIIFKKIRKS